MRDFLAEYKNLLVVLVIFAVGFGLFVMAANKGSTSAAVDDDYKRINFDSPMVKGSADASVQLIQYSDFLCPSCTVVSTQVMPTIEQKYIDTGKVAFEFRPMAFVASSAVTNYASTMAAEGAYCAADQGKFWQYHDEVYAYTFEKIMSSSINPQYIATSTEVLTNDIVKTLASSAGLESGVFDGCLDDNSHTTDVVDGNETANSNGITSAPTVLLNGTDVSSSATNLTALEVLIEAQLK